MKLKPVFAAAVLAMASTSSIFADTGVKEDAKKAADGVSTSAKKAVRSAKDKTCELIDGKVSCAAKKVKHKAQNAIDDIKGK